MAFIALGIPDQSGWEWNRVTVCTVLAFLSINFEAFPTQVMVSPDMSPRGGISPWLFTG
jgi:hypothetical protein